MCNKRLFRYLGVFLLFFLAVFIARSTMWIGERFGATTIDAIIFHYKHSLLGAPPSYLITFLELLVDSLALGTCAVLGYWFTSSFIAGRKAVAMFLSFGVAGLICSTVFFSSRLGLVPYLMGTYKQNTFIEEQYISVRPGDVRFPAQKRNVIVLSLESMEMTFADESLFGTSLIPQLGALQHDNPHVTLCQEKNLSWTVASTTGFLFGLPLYTPTQNYYRSSDNTFLPGAVSLLELFENNGYAIRFILSGKAEFGGAQSLFSNHAPSARVEGREYFERTGIPVRGQWGMRDKDLYGHVKKTLTELSRQGQPFFMLVQTIDTHSYAISYGDYPKPYRDDRDSFIAAGHMALEFINWLKEQDFYKDTTVLVQGDHLYMRQKLGNVLLPDERTIYNVFLNSLIKADISGRQATMMDMGVSLLQAIGVSLPGNAFGLGRSVFSAQPTLVERYGAEGLTKRLSGQSTFYARLFFPQQPREIVSRDPAATFTR